MNVFVIGKSAAADAFIRLLNKTSDAKIWCTQGNPAISAYAECINISPNDITGMVEFAKENAIDITIPLDIDVIQNGITNIFLQEKLNIFAPTIDAAQITTSRAFAKKLFHRQKIQTPKYGIFDREASAIDFLKKISFPVVIKYDYLSDYDTYICSSYSKAKDILEKVFFNVGKKVLVEEFIEGEIIRLGVISDGYNVVPLQYVREYNTIKNENIIKSVGAYAPYNKISSRLEDNIAQKIVFPILDALQSIQTSYIGFLSLKMVVTHDEDIKLLECLPVLSESEAVCTFQMIEDDILKIINAATMGALEDFGMNINMTDNTLASAAIINENPDNKRIVMGIEDLDEDNIELFYNDVGMNSLYEISTSGEKAFYITAKAGTLNKAVSDLYNNIDKINFSGMYYTKDIGKTNKICTKFPFQLPKKMV